MVTSPRPKLEVIDLAITKKILGPGTIERTNIVMKMVIALLRSIGMQRGNLLAICIFGVFNPKPNWNRISDLLP